MRLTLTLALLILGICLVTITEVTPKRYKRATYLQYCPENSTVIECTDYARKLLESKKSCIDFNIVGSRIQWFSCGVINCGEDFVYVMEDLSKPYPNCCKTCKHI